MDIFVSGKTGEGLTELAAFDNALWNLGVGDHNLIHLSSVVPLNTTVKKEAVNYNGQFQGDRIYCVYAEQRTSIPDTTIAAGLGWVMTTEEPSWGLFVEHTGGSKEDVISQIKHSLQSMMEYRTDYTWGEVEYEVASATCIDKPVCAMTLAVYQREAW
ncbi:pyruvoyl-dependent arginine decarboxylase [Candidatus Parcubacteria bacterium]|uniref:Pyruvoyl-dependent arginine decarboxylase AaxB n=1 Tax=Candidatus Kaiserbacteria bacterium CG10_big_fil_rev_8_21_14_0_10_47_16 TaxID=1974608 RepID=A0A2H0UEH9_9BACT|nr:pyruvoyl-dependent arginine decarboxylase [Candidatus Parcubacteria bacterium]PIR84760.1 MAG: pyruvoyl-dependent arginine decarboxylase [Candidatus Kaiserbacteria bacterium CG10_big_fil_rev_8_21_14_0_10_47_16]